MRKEKKSTTMMQIIPKIARKVGNGSVKSACSWMYHQPIVPESMKSKENKSE